MKAALGALAGALIVFVLALQGEGRVTEPRVPDTIRLLGATSVASDDDSSRDDSSTDDAEKVDHRVGRDTVDSIDNSGPGSVNSGPGSVNSGRDDDDRDDDDEDDDSDNSGSGSDNSGSGSDN